MSLPFPSLPCLSSGRGSRVEEGFRLEGGWACRRGGGGGGCHTGILKCNGPRCAAAFFLRSPSQLQHSASAPGSALLGVNKPLVRVPRRRTEKRGAPRPTFPQAAAHSRAHPRDPPAGPVLCPATSPLASRRGPRRAFEAPASSPASTRAPGASPRGGPAETA